MAKLNMSSFDTDVLIVGGGLAGCMAAIRASELGVSVMLAEKADTRRSGTAATGVDHCWTYIPEIHAPKLNYEDIVRDHSEFAGGFIDQEIVLFIAQNSYKRVLDLERFGVPMRDERGNFRLVKKIHRVPTFLHFAGRDLKVKLTAEVCRRPVKLVNRMMISDLLVEDGRVQGAIGINTRTLEMAVIRAKAIVLSTGPASRLYRPATGMTFNIGHPGTVTGDGQAMAYRAGAELVNMEFSTYHTGPRNFQKYGRGSYSPGGVIVDAKGRRLGDAPTPHDGSVTAIDRSVESPEGFMRALEQGRGPIYMDCTGAAPEHIAYMKWALENEGNHALLAHMAEEGIDLAKDRIEFAPFEPKVGGGDSGISIDRDARTSVQGLFAAGDCIGGVKRSVSPGAFTLGYHAAEMAAAEASASPRTELSTTGQAVVENRRQFCEQLLSRPAGATWQEGLLALQNIMDYYAGRIRSETMLDAGYARLLRLRQRVQDELHATNSHELMRCLELMNQMDVCETVILAARERKESRFGIRHHRVDYPQPDDDNWFTFLAVSRQGDRPVLSRKPIKHIV